AVWGGPAWIVAAIVALLMLPPLGALTLARLPRIAQEVAAERGALSEARRRELDNPLFTVSIRTRTAIALGIVFLMTNKPDAIGSAVAIAVALGLGLAFSWPALSRWVRERGTARVAANDAAATAPSRDLNRAA